MTALPAYCPRCHSIFPFHGIALAPGVSIGLESNTTNCPVCGFGAARVADGIYRSTEDAIEVLSGPDSTRAMAEALKLVVERLKAGEISKEQALREAETISPRYAALVDRFSRHGFAALGLFVALLTLYLQYESGRSSSKDAQRLLDAITQQTFVIQRAVEEQRIERERSTLPRKQSRRKTPIVNNKLKRRAQLYKQRRAGLRARRCDFGGARTH